MANMADSAGIVLLSVHALREQIRIPALPDPDATCRQCTLERRQSGRPAYGHRSGDLCGGLLRDVSVNLIRLT